MSVPCNCGQGFSVAPENHARACPVSQLSVLGWIAMRDPTAPPNPTAPPRMTAADIGLEGPVWPVARPQRDDERGFVYFASPDTFAEWLRRQPNNTEAP